MAARSKHDTIMGLLTDEWQTTRQIASQYSSGLCDSSHMATTCIVLNRMHKWNEADKRKGMVDGRISSMWRRKGP